jgi:hypothetical protein
MHFVSRMTGKTGHSNLVPMQIAGNAFILALVLHLYSTTVTSGTGQIHWWDFFEFVSGGQTTTQVCGPTHVTLAATGMATFAMVAKGFFNMRPGFFAGAILNYGIITSQRRMQTMVIIMHIGMALVTGFSRNRFTTHINVGSFFIFGQAVATVTCYATHFAVDGFGKILITD